MVSKILYHNNSKYVLFDKKGHYYIIPTNNIGIIGIKIVNRDFKNDTIVYKGKIRNKSNA